MSAGEGDEAVDAALSEVLDPEDYSQNQRLKDIHEARRAVREAQEDLVHGTAAEGEHKASHNHLAGMVALYGSELKPLMDDLGWSHKFDDIRFKPPDAGPDSVREFITRVGTSPDWDNGQGTPPAVSLLVFRKLNKFAREAGLGADLDSDPDEWEI